jgi:hypothetical protein
MPSRYGQAYRDERGRIREPVQMPNAWTFIPWIHVDETHYRIWYLLADLFQNPDHNVELQNFDLLAQSGILVHDASQETNIIAQEIAIGSECLNEVIHIQTRLFKHFKQLMLIVWLLHDIKVAATFPPFRLEFFEILQGL